MSVSAKSYLSSTNFIELDNWSVQYLFETSFSYNDKYNLTKIGSFLTRNKTNINILDNKNYKRVTIKINNGGIFLRNIEQGINIGTKKQFIVKQGQFLVSKIDARNGAFGVIPNKLDNAIITGNFWTFDVDYSLINPHFLSLITTTKEFLLFCSNASNGTTNRHYLQEKAFLNVKIPLPSIKEQNELLEEYNNKILSAEKQEKEAKEIEESIEKYLFEELGIEKIEEKVKSSKLQFVESKNIDRWDTLFLIGNIPTLKAKYSIMKFLNIITHFTVNENKESLRINSKNYPDEDFIYIGMEHIEKETGTLLSLHNAKGEEIKSQTIKVPNNYLLFGKLRPYLNKYWINELNKDNIICSSEFFVFDIDKKINKLFFKYCLSSNFIQMQITDKTSGARMPRINEATFMSLETPIPPIKIQNIIAIEITKRKEKIKHLKQQALKNREDAIKEFEEEIFNEA